MIFPSILTQLDKKSARENRVRIPPVRLSIFGGKGKAVIKFQRSARVFSTRRVKLHHRNVCTKHRRGGFRIRPLLSRAPPNRARLNKQVVRQSSGFFRRGGGSPPASLFFYFHKRVGNRHPRCQRYPKAVASAIRMSKCKCCYLEMLATNRQIFDRAVRICRKKIFIFFVLTLDRSKKSRYNGFVERNVMEFI